MLLNIRYYILMITSVFLALGIGIIIGFSLDGQEIFVEQQQGLINELEQRFEEIRNENISLKTMTDIKDFELALYESFSKNIFSRLVKDCLCGLKVAVIDCGDTFTNIELVDTLELAGATVSSVTMLKEEFFNPDLQNVVVFNEGKDGPMENDQMYSCLSDRLVDAVVSGDDEGHARRMKELGFIKITGEYDSVVDYFIITGCFCKGNDNRAETAGISLLEAVKNSSIPVVGVEKSSCEESYITHYKTMEISSVDNIDSIIGRYSLVKVLQGSEGHYGVKDTADALVPGIDTTM
jgi:hypothetical protein